jgi:hypothetical protein
MRLSGLNQTAKAIRQLHLGDRAAALNLTPEQVNSGYLVKPYTDANRLYHGALEPKHPYWGGYLSDDQVMAMIENPEGMERVRPEDLALGQKRQRNSVLMDMTGIVLGALAPGAPLKIALECTQLRLFPQNTFHATRAIEWAAAGMLSTLGKLAIKASEVTKNKR